MRYWSVAAALLAQLYEGTASAGPCEPVESMSKFSFAFDRTFSSPDENAADALYPNAYEWNLGRSYAGRCACSGSSISSGTYYTTRTSLPNGVGRVVNGVNIQFYEINRNLQMGTEIYLAGGVKKFRPTPWTNQYNENVGSFACRNGVTVDVPFESGARGRLHLLIRRPFVGTIRVPEFKVLEVLGSMRDSSAAPTKPLVGLFMSMNVTVPQNCRLAAGQLSTIDFGALIPAALASPGSVGLKPVQRNFYIQCANISAGVKINLALEGRPHGLDARYLETTHQGVAVAMESGGKLVPPSAPGSTPAGNQLIPIALDYQSLQAQFELLAWPVKMTERPAPGGFQGSATLKFDFE